MRALLVHNPTAGKGRPTGEELLAILDAAGFSTTYCSSKKDDYKEALAHPTDIVIVAGGDGTVAKVARSLPDRKTLFAILPFGTANNISRSLNITGDLETLARNLRGAPVTRLDLARAVGPWGTRHFLESVGWGALAKVVDSEAPDLPTEEQVKWGRKSFAKILGKAKPKRVVIEADGERIEGDFLLVEVLNLGMTGPRMLISPSAKPGDQTLDVVFLTEQRRQEMIDWLSDGPDDRRPPLSTRKAKKVNLSWKEGPLRIDDEVLPAPVLPSNIIIEVESEGLRVCVPSGEKGQPEHAGEAAASS